MGRKKKKKYERRDRKVFVRMTESEYDELDILAEIEGCSKSEMMRRLIQKEIKKYMP